MLKTIKKQKKVKVFVPTLIWAILSSTPLRKYYKGEVQFLASRESKDGKIIFEENIRGWVDVRNRKAKISSQFFIFYYYEVLKMNVATYRTLHFEWKENINSQKNGVLQKQIVIVMMALKSSQFKYLSFTF